jgi:trehalose 6-phosphate phosphatase
MQVTSISDAAVQILAALRSTPSGLFTDIDGTISHVAATPEEARIVDNARVALEQIAEKITIVGAITGRAAESAHGLLGVEGAIVIGNHGYERWHKGERWIHPSAISSRAEIAVAVDAISVVISSAPLLEGAIVENKDLSASVHYRRVSDQVKAQDLLRRLVLVIAELHDLVVTEGKLVFEIRPKATVNKGTAIHDIAMELGLLGVVYLGDDVTDVDAFRSMSMLDKSTITSLSVGIVSEETHDSVKEAADLLVNGVDDCVELLQEVAARL